MNATAVPQLVVRLGEESATDDRVVGRKAATLARLRSSGVAEDLAGASFAGQYESVLGVRGLADLVSAIGRCRVSVSSERVTAYRAEAGAGDAGMALLVQDLVDAEAAGVAFTATPVTGDVETLVSAIRGLGERLVSGGPLVGLWYAAVSVQALRLRHLTPRARAGRGEALDDDT